jgi:hypothetical protein
MTKKDGRYVMEEEGKEEEGKRVVENEEQSVVP